MPFPPLADDVRDAIADAGAELMGVTPAVASDGFSNLVRWIDSGYAAEMDYFANRLDAYRHPDGVLAGCRTLIALAFPYHRSTSHPGVGGKVARYAWSAKDYHDQIHDRLRVIKRRIADRHDGASARVVVDTAPLMEREIAAAAGLGWRGKNTLLLNKSLGSYFFLACILTDVALRSEVPHQDFAVASDDGHCGTCTACLDQCPTDAFVRPGVLDSRRCISYLTIEHRGPIDPALRSSIGDWIFGCDVCQEVCPWNRRGRSDEPEATPVMPRLDPCELFTVDDDEFRRRFRKTPLWRSRRRGLLRNAAIVIGNTDPPGALAAVDLGLRDDDPIVRGAAVWALGRLRPPRHRNRLRMMRQAERDAVVIEEIDAVLGTADETG